MVTAQAIRKSRPDPLASAPQPLLALRAFPALPLRGPGQFRWSWAPPGAHAGSWDTRIWSLCLTGAAAATRCRPCFPGRFWFLSLWSSLRAPQAVINAGLRTD